MRRALLIILGLLLGCLLPETLHAQRITNGSYQTVAHIKSDGIPMKWAAFFFFFSK